MRKPKRLRLNLGPGQDDGLCGGGRGCARELGICIAGSTLGVPSVGRARSAFDCPPLDRRKTRCLTTYLSYIICLTYLMNHSPRRMLSARYDRNHIPRIPIPIHDRRLISFARPNRLDFETESVAGHPGTRDVELLRAVATANYSATPFGTETAGLEICRRSVIE